MNRFLPALWATAALALAAVPAIASDAPGPGPGSGGPPPCEPGQYPSEQSPCSQPPCAAGTQPTRENPCMPPPCQPGTQPSPENPCSQGPNGGPGGPYQGGPGGPPNGQPGGPNGPHGGPGGPPTFAGGFLSRVWRFTAEADSYDAAKNVLNVTVTKIVNLPKKFANQDDEIVDQDAYVIFSASTKVYSGGKRVPKEQRYDALLDNADTVLVAGKMIPPAKWQKDEDDTPVTTIRAKRVSITG
jgi:hypothetical protein